MEVMGEGEYDKEPIDLVNAVLCKNNIEDWLGDLEKQMQNTMKSLIYKCYNKYIVQKEALDIEAMLDNTCSQVALIGVQMRWTKLIHDALHEKQNMKPKAHGEAKQEVKLMLDKMTDLCKTELKSELVRSKYETIVTILVYLN
jgi:hypothetical protein